MPSNAVIVATMAACVLHAVRQTTRASSRIKEIARTKLTPAFGHGTVELNQREGNKLIKYSDPW